MCIAHSFGIFLVIHKTINICYSFPEIQNIFLFSFCVRRTLSPVVLSKEVMKSPASDYSIYFCFRGRLCPVPSSFSGASWENHGCGEDQSCPMCDRLLLQVCRAISIINVICAGYGRLSVCA